MSPPPRRLTAYLPHLALATLLLGFLLDPASPLGHLDLCALHRITGLPCPGCGITRALVRCTQGHWRSAFEAHPLGPLVWLGAVGCASALVWPRSWRERYTRWTRTHALWTTLLLWGLVALLMLFWVARILFIWRPAPRGWTWSSGYALHVRP